MSAEHIHARGLLQNIHDTTPGGVTREQFMRKRAPIKTLLEMFPFLLLVALTIVAVSH